MEKNMKTLQILRNASIATLTLAAVTLPTVAQASDYNRGYVDQSRACKSKENDAQLVGGLLGAVIGGVVGSEIAGHGNRDEGAVIGAVIGGLAGVGVGDESVNCDKRRRRAYYNGGYSNTNYRGTTYRNGYRPTTYSYGNGNRRGYNNNGYNNGYNGYETPYERHDHQERIRKYNDTYAQLQDVQYRLHDLRKKDRRLENKIRYANDAYHAHDLQERRDRVRNEIARLHKKEHRFQRRLRRLKRRSY
jgi:uncharacterized protein YcfJ